MLGLIIGLVVIWLVALFAAGGYYTMQENYNELKARFGSVKTGNDFVIDVIRNNMRDIANAYKELKDELKELDKDVDNIDKSSDEFFYFYMIQEVLYAANIKHNRNIDMHDLTNISIDVEWVVVELSKEWMQEIIKRFWYNNLASK